MYNTSVIKDCHLGERSMNIHSNHTHDPSPSGYGSRWGNTTSTDSRSQRSRASRRGGQVTTRVHNSRSGRPATVSCSQRPYPGGRSYLIYFFRSPRSAGNTIPFNNAAERALRGIALGRRNWTFAGSQRGANRAAIMLSVITTCRLNDVDPKAWLADVFARIADLPVSPPARATALAMEGPQRDGYYGGRVNSSRNNASERAKPSSVRINAFDLLTGSPIKPFL